MSRLGHSLRIIFRGLVRRPGSTAVIVATLAMGIGATAAVFSALHAVLLQPLPYPDSERLILGRGVFKQRYRGQPVSAHNYVDYRREARSFDSLAAFTPWPNRVVERGGAEPEHVVVSWVSENLFRTLGVAPSLGRDFALGDAIPGAPDVVIISHAYWQRRFGGSPEALGRPLVLGELASTVIGVMPAGFRTLSFAGSTGYQFRGNIDVWTPMRLDGPWANARRFTNFFLVGRLRGGVTKTQAQAEADAIFGRLAVAFPTDNADQGLALDRLHVALAEKHGERAQVLMAAVGFVLLIACGNVAGLLLAGGVARQGELAVRATLGASRSRLAGQLLSESVLLAILGGCGGLVLVAALVQVLPSLLALDLLGFERLSVNVPILVFTTAVVVTVGVGCGVLPALRQSRVDLVRDLGSVGRSPGEGRAGRFQAGLVVAQVMLSCVLLVGAGLLVRSVRGLLLTDPGFDTTNLYVAEVAAPPARYSSRASRVQLFGEILDGTSRLDGVAGAALVSHMPLRDFGENLPAWPRGAPPEARGTASQSALARVVFPGYFAALGVPVLRGRDVGPDDRADAPGVVVLSRDAAATYFPGIDPVGQHLEVDTGGAEAFEVEVVGVVGDVRGGWIGDHPERTMYFSHFQSPGSSMCLAVRTVRSPAEVLADLRDVVRRIDRGIPVDDLVAMDRLIRRSIGVQQRVATVLSSFAVVALLLAAVGLYGVLAFWVSRRNHEIGVRLALGGSPAQVFHRVATKGGRLVLAGVVLGMVGAAAVGRLLASQLAAIEVFDPLVFVAAPVTLLAVAALACWLPARRAARLDPLRVLRAE